VQPAPVVASPVIGDDVVDQRGVAVVQVQPAAIAVGSVDGDGVAAERGVAVAAFWYLLAY
jgi:hypothetical protein